MYLYLHHSGQNAVDSRGAAEWIRSKFDYCDDEYRRRYQTTLHQFHLCIILYFILIKTLPSVIISALYFVVVRFI